MKNKIFIAIDILLGIALIVCIVFFTNAKKEQSELDKKLSTAESAYKAKEAEYQLKTAPNEISTPDEIAIMKRELNDLSKEKDGGVESFKQMFFNYIDTLYNTDGNFQSNKSKIIESLKNIVSPAMMENKIEPMFSIGSGNGTKTEKKKISNFCNLNDIYINKTQAEDGSLLYTAVCRLHYDGFTETRLLSAANIGDNVVITDDDVLINRLPQMVLGG